MTLLIKSDMLCAMNRKERSSASKKCGENALLRAMSEAKKLSGLSQRAIAERIGMPQSNVSRIEHSGGVSFNTFSEYIAACGFDFDINLRPVGATHERSGM